MRALAAVPERHASFTEEKHFAALDRPLIAHGNLDYRRPDHLSKSTTDPIAETLTVDADRLTVVAGGTTRDLRLTDQPALAALVQSVLGVLAGDLQGVQAHYALTLEGTTRSWSLVLSPRDPAVRQLLASVRITGADATPTLFETIQANGDSQTLRIAPR